MNEPIRTTARNHRLAIAIALVVTVTLVFVGVFEVDHGNGNVDSSFPRAAGVSAPVFYAQCRRGVCAGVRYSDPFSAMASLDALTLRVTSPVAKPTSSWDARYGGWSAVYDHGQLVAPASSTVDVYPNAQGAMQH
jgi:hypothetical protein